MTILAQLLSRTEDERLVEAAATAAHIGVTVEEVDEGVLTVARANDVTVEQLLDAARRQGLPPGDYRAEISRLILENKALHAYGRDHATGEALEQQRRQWIAELRSTAPRPRLIGPPKQAHARPANSPWEPSPRGVDFLEGRVATALDAPGL